MCWIFLRRRWWYKSEYIKKTRRQQKVNREGMYKGGGVRNQSEGFILIRAGIGVMKAMFIAVFAKLE
jgi:hypothetical protein